MPKPLPEGFVPTVDLYDVIENGDNQNHEQALAIWRMENNQEIEANAHWLLDRMASNLDLSENPGGIVQLAFALAEEWLLEGRARRAMAKQWGYEP